MERFYIRNALTNVNGTICLTILGTGGDASTIQTTTYWYGSKQYDTIRSCEAKDGQPYTYWLPNRIPLDVMVRLEVRIDRGFIDLTFKSTQLACFFVLFSVDAIHPQ